ncbi:MAG TPA: tetratricopeptide repeat protein, partial [Ignavibacteriaceae bacterium]
MIIQKISILLLAFIVSFLQPAENDSNYSSNSPQDHISSPDSLLNEIKAKGWTNSILNSIKDYLINSEAPAGTKFSLLNDFKADYHKALLYSVLLKKQNKFTAMYDTLAAHLNSIPDYLPYYDELVFAANASSRLSILESQIESSGEFHPKEKNYLLGLITYQETDYDSARKFFEKCLLLDSTNKYIQYQLSYSYRSLGDYKKALDLIKKSENNSPGDLPFLIKAYLAEGALYYLSGEYDLADAIYKKSYTLSQVNKLNETEGLSLVALG